MVFGCGDLGGAVAREGRRRSMRVTALTRNAATADELRADGIEVVVADLADTNWHAEIAGGADFALNSVSSGGGGIDRYRRSYVVGLRSVVRWMGECGRAGTFVYTSSTSVYPQDDGARMDEDAPTAQAAERGQILLEAENLLRANGGTCARWFVLRLAGLYGPGRTHLIEQVRSGKIAGRGEHRLNLIHRDDAVAAIWAAFEAPAGVTGEVFNVADDGAAPKAEVVTWLAQRLGVPAPVFTGAPAAGRSGVTPDRVIANDRIKRVLGWAPRFATFRDGFENVLAGERNRS